MGAARELAACPCIAAERAGESHRARVPLGVNGLVDVGGSSEKVIAIVRASPVRVALRFAPVHRTFGLFA